MPVCAVAGAKRAVDSLGERCSYLSVRRRHDPGRAGRFARMLTRPSLVQLCLSPIDFRKNIDTLALLVSAEMSEDPLSGTMFVFFNRGLDKVKILQYARHGFWLFYKRLERGRFVLPPLSCLSFLDLQLLLEGIDLSVRRFRAVTAKRVASVANMPQNPSSTRAKSCLKNAFL